MIKRTISFMLMPSLVLAAAFMAQSHIGSTGSSFRRLFPYIPYIIFSAALILCLRFNVSRTFHIIIAMALSYHGFLLFLQKVSGDIHAGIVLLSVTTLLPINLAIFSILKERGIFTAYGIARALFVFLQAGYVAKLLKEGNSVLYRRLTDNYLDISMPAWLPFSQLELACMGLSLALLMISSSIRRTPVEKSLIGLLAAIILARYFYSTDYMFTLFYCAGGLILAIGVVQKSHDMAYRDELTGLPGRRALNERLLMLGRNYTIAMLDVDHFKKFNDTYGHDIGDQVLKMVASRMQKVSGGGRPYRYGGEEFTVIFPGRDTEYAIPHLEALREDIEAYSMAIRGKDRPSKKGSGKSKRGKSAKANTVSVTISIGLSQKSGDTASPGSVIKAADEALYRAKKKGRNCVSL